MKKILLIIPAYNEETNILNTINAINTFNNLNKTKYDILVINDGSNDNTESLLLENKICHIYLITNLGIGGAVQTGYKYALENKYDIAVQFDGDGQHNVDYIKNIIEPIIEKKCDLCIGSRFISSSKEGFKSTNSRRVGIKIISFFIFLFTRKKIFDPTSGFRAANSKIIEMFANDYPVEYPEPVSIIPLIKSKYVFFEVPVTMNERKNGNSSINSWKNLYYMVNVVLSIIISSMRRGYK